MNTELQEEHQIVVATEEYWGGPLPPPVELKGYEDALPGLAERIVRMAEQQAEMRRASERARLDSSIKIAEEQVAMDTEKMRRNIALKARGQWMAMASVLIFIIASLVVAICGCETLAITIIACATLGQVVNAFLSHSNKNKEP